MDISGLYHTHHYGFQLTSASSSSIIPVFVTEPFLSAPKFVSRSLLLSDQRSHSIGTPIYVPQFTAHIGADDFGQACPVKCSEAFLAVRAGCMLILVGLRFLPAEKLARVSISDD